MKRLEHDVVRFETCLPVILSNEGGYVDRSQDRGGATMCGVTQAVYDAYRLRNKLPQQPVKFSTEEERQEIYHADYWQKAGCDRCADPLALVLFDSAVNDGVSRSVRWLQSLVNVGQDGGFGEKTAKAIIDSGYSALELAKELLDRREDYYHAIVDINPSQSIFLHGWLNRVAKLRGML